MTNLNPSAAPTAVVRAAELALAARNAWRLLAGGRMTDGPRDAAPFVDPEPALRDARSRFAVPTAWTPGSRLSTVTDVAVVELCLGADTVAVLKLACTPAGDACLLRQQHTLERISGAARLGRWRALLPDVLAHGIVGDHRYSIERLLPGTVGSSLPGPLAATDALRDAGRVIAEFHSVTGRVEVPSSVLLDRWVEPALLLLSEVPMLLGPARRQRLVMRLRDRIRAGIEGRALWVGRTHGDFVAGNILFAGSTVTGIIDWDRSQVDGVALVDPMTLLLTDRARAAGTALGGVVRDLCHGAPLTYREQGLLDGHRAACPADTIEPDVLGLLAWLQHVRNNLLKSSRYRSHPAWVHRNIETVLKAADARPAGQRRNSRSEALVR